MLDNFKKNLSTNVYKGRLFLGCFLILLLLIWLVGLIYHRNTQEHYNDNFQRFLDIDEQQIMNDKMYIKDNKVVATFHRRVISNINTYEVVTYSQEELEGKLSTPIYMKYGTTNEDFIDGTHGFIDNSKYKRNKINYIGENYMKIGENELFDMSKIDEQNKDKYVIIELYGNVNANQANESKVPKDIIYFHISELQEYIDIKDLDKQLYKIKNDKKLSKKYSKWLYQQEINPQIISQIFDNQVDTNAKYKIKTLSSEINQNNVLDIVEELYTVQQKLMINYGEISQVLQPNLNLNYYRYLYMRDTYYNKNEVLKLVLYTNAVTGFNNADDRDLDKVIDKFTSNISSEDSKYKLYFDLSDTLNKQQKAYILWYCSVNA